MRYGEAWLRNTLGRRIRPEWNDRLRGWALPKRYLVPLAEALGALLRGKPFALVQDFVTSQRCDIRCWKADPQGICVCSCQRRNHGCRHTRKPPPPGWLRAGKTVLVWPGRSRTVELIVDEPER